MSKLSSFWTIEKIELVNKIPIAPQAPENPHNLEVFCRVYEIVDLDDLFKFLDKMDNINEIVEVPYGIHLKITSYDDEFNQGISFLGDSIADIIINGDEFVLICDEADILQDFHTTLFYESVPPLIPRGEYQIDLVTAYNYVNGRYMSFEDILIADSDDLLGENDLRFMSTVYFVKDRQPVLTKIRNTPNVTCVIDGEFSIFYQYEFKGDDKVVLAEYVLGDDWLTLSTFGFDDMFLVRETFEPSLYKYLEIEGTEIKKGGFFDILTEGMKQNYPDLEKFLKELYLNKWYNSQLSVLEGMTPSEASETEEGKKLLWTLIKKIHQNDACNLGRGKRSTIKVNEYINLIEEKRKEKP